MALYFLDSSAIVKRYVSEAGHVWIASLCDPIQNHDIQIAQIALVEVSIPSWVRTFESPLQR